MHLENNLKNGIDELIEDQEEVIEALSNSRSFLHNSLLQEKR
jgi:hypothetical protein